MDFIERLFYCKVKDFCYILVKGVGMWGKEKRIEVSCVCENLFFIFKLREYFSIVLVMFIKYVLE